MGKTTKKSRKASARLPWLLLTLLCFWLYVHPIAAHLIADAANYRATEAPVEVPLKPVGVQVGLYTAEVVVAI